MADLKEEKVGDHSGAKEGGMFSIDRSEFDRLQMQLIELRTANYQLKEQHSKTSAELTKFQQTVQSQTRELDRANKAIQRSKKAKEFSTLVEENDSIQRKLERQEEDFRLQNQTLMQELSKICEEKDSLEAELERAKRGGAMVTNSDSGGDITHLRAENAALLKSVQGLKEQLKEVANDDNDGGSPSSPVTPDSDKVMDLQLRLSTEEEEKKLLQSKLAELQENARKEQADLQAEVEKWTEKAKKKQDSFVQLQEEKEKQFYENRSAFNEMVRSKDHEIQTLQNSLRLAQKDLEARNEASETSQDINKQLESMRTSNEELNLRSTALMQDKEVLVAEKVELEGLLSELGRELQQAKADLGEERKAGQDLMAQLEEAKMSQERLADQVVSTSEDKHKMTVELEKLNKLAEKRKSMLDEMAIREQESTTERQRKEGELEDRFKDEVAKLEDLLQQEQSRNWKLTEEVEELPVLRQKCKEQSERSESVAEALQEAERMLSEEREESRGKITEMETLHQQQKMTLEEELEAARAELEQNKERIQELESEMEDKQEAVRIVEKKSQSLLKDLKRQLQQMHKKEERLQEQVSEMRGVQAVDLQRDFQREISHDVGSTHSRESSLSSVRGTIKMADTPDTPGSAVALSNSFAQVSTSGSVTEETQELLARLAELQQDKWTLEEKVHHLENTGSALAEDVIQKSEIIKTYFMENRADHSPQVKRPSFADKLSPMKLLPRSRSKEETLEEINRKMQRALEEALMKNIHLQQNLETLTAALATEESSSGATGEAESSTESPHT